MSADAYSAQARDAGKAAVGTASGRRGHPSAELPSYIQSSGKVSYGALCMRVQLCFTKESLIFLPPCLILFFSS